MSVKYFGIYLAYPPLVDLRHEGLGRYLASFLKGAAARDDVRFVVLCPSWSRESLQQLFASERVPAGSYEIRCPAQKPLVLSAYETWRNYRQRSEKSSLRTRTLDRLRALKSVLVGRVEKHLVNVHSITTLIAVLPEFILLAIAGVLLAPFALLAVATMAAVNLSRRIFRRGARPLLGIATRLRGALANPKDEGFVVRLYQRMAEAEAARMARMIDAMSEVRAWYCPTAFWPAFNDIKAPKLMCVPDLVLAEFAVDYAGVGGDRFLATFDAVEASIRQGRHFVTYSAAIRQQVLTDRYGVRPDSVSVIHHAPSELGRWITISGFDDASGTQRNYCELLLQSALRKAANPAYSAGFANGSVKFLFYASQFRPNKNLITLLRAYEYLLRTKRIGHKLILTGSPASWPPVQRFIDEYRLGNDVLCLHKLRTEELAACYRLADLAVNPSLSEGGCPFTFTEALSVDTPVVMAKIPVSEEVLTDPELRAMTFFDPYDWQDMAQRIEWALDNREQLLAVQRRTYAQLLQRTWTDVVDEHIETLDRIAQEAV